MRQPVCIVADSTADIPAELARDLGIIVVPLSVTVGGETFLDGELTQEEFFARMRASKRLPTTSQPPVGAFVEAFRQALERSRDVVALTCSSALSGTYQSACGAADIVADRVRVFDTRKIVWAEGIQAVLAARAARAGASVQEVLQVAERARDTVRIIVGLDSLDNLIKGGRIGRLAGFVGTLLDVKVLVNIPAAGNIVPVARLRGTHNAMRASIEWLAERIDPRKPTSFGIQHALSPQKVPDLEAALRSRFNVAELFVIPTGATICTHAGTGWAITAVELE